MAYGRAIFAALMLTVGGIFGGWWGVYAALLLTWFFMWVFLPAPKQKQTKQTPREQRQQFIKHLQTLDDFKDDVVIGARKGHPDQTRPD